ncbi:LPXTG cell wall anchor domain-containing protein, partial [Clostridium perfringens]
LTYTVTDTDGNTTIVKRIISIVKNETPSIDDSSSKQEDKVTLPTTGTTTTLPIIGTVLIGLGGLLASRKNENK